MRDILPDHVMAALHDRFVAGVSDAVAKFSLHRADEDSVSGALGQSLAMRDPVIYTGPQGDYEVEITYKKIRGRGPGAPEKTYGADGFFQIIVTDDEGNVMREKGLPYQAKINWNRQNRDLANQASKMIDHFACGLVVSFTPQGYRACSAQAVAAMQGSFAQVHRAGDLHSLDQVLGNDFLECRIGTIGLYFDPDRELFFGAEAPPPAHVVTASISRLRE